MEGEPSALGPTTGYVRKSLSLLYRLAAVLPTCCTVLMWCCLTLVLPHFCTALLFYCIVATSNNDWRSVAGLPGTLLMRFVVLLYCPAHVLPIHCTALLLYCPKHVLPVHFTALLLPGCLGC
jgi:hypothetical protein